MEKIDLIADSGIQFHRVELEFDLNEEVLQEPIYFIEILDFENEKIILEFARYLEEQDVYARDKDLSYAGFIDADGQLFDDIDINEITTYTEDDVYSIYDVQETLEVFNGHWLPLPYFSFNNGAFDASALNWCRIKFSFKEKKGKSLRYSAILAFDTNTHAGDDGEGPVIEPGREHASYSLCSNVDQILNYCGPEHGFNFFDDYLEVLDDKWKARLGFHVEDEDGPKLKHIARYVHFVKYMTAMGGLPAIHLSRFAPEKAIDVDLILDIGNSRTNGILVEAPHNQHGAFDFTKVEALKLQDLFTFDKVYEEPFSMRLAFHKTSFGDIGGTSRQFTWPSFMRLGQEAINLIYQESDFTEDEGKEATSYYSSPKRYLWDTRLAETEWKLVKVKGEEELDQDLYVNGISIQFKEDGSFTPNAEFGLRTRFSRKSLMTFAFIEILAQAFTQVNSHTFRQKHGAFRVGRRIRRVVVTCPTAMTQQEQVNLRECAEEASIAISRFYANSYSSEFIPEESNHSIQIIPSVSDCKKDQSTVHNKKDWSYDEATCCQLVFMYAEVAQRYNNKSKHFFELYGKVRDDLEDYTKKSVTVASVDIGGGTTDLMINAYKYDGETTAAIEPVPLYWESFNTAGDDLLKAIIKKVILDHPAQEQATGDYGLISWYAQQNGVKDISIRLNRFFGTDSNNFGYHSIQMRKKFNVQVLIPIAEFYLAHLNEDRTDAIYNFDDLFPSLKPSAELLDFFASHWGFRFEEIQWPLKKGVTEGIVESVFEDLIKHLTILAFVKKCDFLLLAGRPTSLPTIYQLFLKYFPVSPDRILSLRDYRVGRWYPFQDGNGKFKDYKSIVSVGAAIALMAGKLDRLAPFRLRMDRVKRDIGPTSEFFGFHDPGTNSFKEAFIDPETNRANLKIESFPRQIATKQLLSGYYPARLIYELDFDYEYIKERVKERYADEDQEMLRNKTEEFIIQLKNKTPFTFSIVRQYNKNKEILKIENILDGTPKAYFTLKLKTINERKGHWLDTGEFVLSVNPE